MSGREAFLRIHIVDAQGAPRAPGPKDKVVLKDRASSIEKPPHERYSDEKGFTYKLDTSELELSVQMAGCAEIRQWFAIESSEQPRLVPFWPGTDRDLSANKRRDGYLLQCIQLAGGAPDHGPSGDIWDATVTLHPTREYVAVIGTDYWEGALSGSRHPKRASLPFLDYSITYGDHLHATAAIHASSPLTMLDCQRGVIEVWMRVAGKGWRRQFIRPERTKKPAPAWPAPRHFVEWIQDLISGKCAASDYLGARDIYKYLSDAGVARPGTVADFSIFSHAWAGGPILFNTMSSPAAERLESDLDMRTIDFLPENSSSWSHLPDAFAPGGSIHVWGCYSTTVYNQMVTYLNRAKADAKDYFQWKDGSTEITFARPEVIQILNEAIDVHSYMKQVARYAKRPAYGGPPGFGSEWMHYADLPMISKALKKDVHGKIMHIPATARPKTGVRKLYEGPELGSRRFDEFGYMLYTP